MLDSTPNVSPRVWQVGSLCLAAADALDQRFNPVAVVGEISGFTRASSGHCYFTLKDERAQLRCAMFRRAASLLNFSPRDGDQVELRGRLGVYEPRGDLQLVVESLSKAGAGALMERFLLLKARLEAQGLFSAQRKRKIPAMPRTIGVVTSLGAAALHDVVTALQRRAPHVPVLLVPAQVQGLAAAQEVVQALQSLYRLARDGAANGLSPDVILLVRGGGSLEDLWTFNEEAVVRCVAESPVPLISGIGHETDFTLVDFAADLRAPTPTAAAELASTSRDELAQALDALRERARASVGRTLDRQAQRLDLAGARLGRPRAAVARAREALVEMQHGMQRHMREALQLARYAHEKGERSLQDAIRSRLQPEAQGLERLGIRLAGVDPALVLQRGYAWLADDAGRPVTTVRQTYAGQVLQASLADGRVDLRVTSASSE